MPERSLTDALHGLADALRGRRDLASLRATVLSWADTSGGRVEEEADAVVIHFLQEGVVFTVSLSAAGDQLTPAVSSPIGSTPDQSRPGARVLERTSVRSSASDVAAAVNGGLLTKEIDAAVGWDPELAV